MRKSNAENRTAILVRCTEKEAKLIRHAARNEGRTISNFILNLVDRHLAAAPNKVQVRLQGTYKHRLPERTTSDRL